jgi:hypothetical protein
MTEPSHDPLKNLSGIVINQDQAPMSNADKAAISQDWRYQEFILPTDYARGTEAGEIRYPSLSGISLAMEVPDLDAVELEFYLERNVFGLGWLSQATGSVLRASATGTLVWVDVYLEKPVEIDTDSYNDRWRFSFRGTGGNAWLSVPNPLVLPSNARAYAEDGITPLQLNGQDTSFMFRVLGLTADEGVDFLGNNFRSVVTTQDVGNVVTGEGSEDDTFWLSKPNPSKFAVESLYFDLTPNSIETHAVIDSVIVDPITPGIFFHIYYSDEGDPETDSDAWDNKLWKRVPQTFRAIKRDRFVLPEPISARYIKIEFSHLQARFYDPGDFAQPVTYKKHPKWVLDYFLLRYGTDSLGPAQRVGLIWNSLDLAYNYYLDDIRQEPDQPIQVDSSQVDSVVNFLRHRTDVSDQVDPMLLGRINLALKPFQENPIARTAYDSLLGEVLTAQSYVMDEYPTETAVTFTNETFDDVSTLRNERIVFEQSYPVMFFYLTCRHKYREVQASFSHNRAYFAGVRQIAFTRENYTAAHDTSLYIEAENDQVNVEYNDFVVEDNQWVVYTE